MIALSIVFVAAEIVHGLRGRPGLTARAPWIVAFSFGLLHGFGFAGALAQVGLPQKAVPLALLMFNVGVEVGKLMFVAFAVGARAVWTRCPSEPRMDVVRNALRDWLRGDVLGGGGGGVLLTDEQGSWRCSLACAIPLALPGIAR